MLHPIIDEIINGETSVDYGETIGSLEYVKTIIDVRNKAHEQKRNVQKNRRFIGRELEMDLIVLFQKIEDKCNKKLMRLTEANYG